MSDKEQMITEMSQALFSFFPDIDTRKTATILSVCASKYSVSKIETAVSLSNADINIEILQSFLISKKVAGRSEKTCKYYRYVLSDFLRKVNKSVLDVEGTDITVYLAKKEIENGNSAVSRDNARRVIRVFYQWMVDQEKISRNPCRNVVEIKKPKIQKSAFSDYEVEKLRAGCESDLERLLVELLLSTGCRIGEVELIQASDISGDAFVVHGKGDKERTVFLNAKARHALDVYKQGEFYAGRKDCSDGGLFLAQRKREGKYRSLKIASLEDIVKKIGMRAGVPDCHPHRFRRTCATNALRRGMPIEQVSRMLGHEDISTTRIYLDLTDEDLKQSHAKFVY